MRVIHEANFENENQITFISLSQDLKKIAYCYSRRFVYIQQTKECQITDIQHSGQTIDIMKPMDGNEYESYGEGMKFSPDCNYLIVFIYKYEGQSGPIMSLQIWATQGNILISKNDYEFNEFIKFDIEQFEFSQDSTLLAIPQHGILKIKSNELKNMENEFIHGTFSLDSQFLAYVHYKKRIRILNLNEERIIYKSEKLYQKICKIVFLSNNIIAFALSKWKCISIRDWQINQEIQSFYLHQYKIDNFSVSYDRSMLISHDNDNFVYLWKNVSMKKKNHNQPQKNQVMNEYFFILHSAFNHPRLNCVDNVVENSQFTSVEGFNLLNVFKYNLNC